MNAGLLDRTINNLWRVWGEVSNSTLSYLQAGPRPELPSEDLERVFDKVDKCIDGIGDEASLRSQAAQIGQIYITLNAEGRRKFLVELGKRYGVDREKVDASIDSIKQAGSSEPKRSSAEEKLRRALEPRWRSLIGRLTTLPEGVKFLVDMRAEMLSWQPKEEALTHV